MPGLYTVTVLDGEAVPASEACTPATTARRRNWPAASGRHTVEKAPPASAGTEATAIHAPDASRRWTWIVFPAASRAVPEIRTALPRKSEWRTLRANDGSTGPEESGEGAA